MKAKEALLKIKKLLDDNNIIFWLYAGTLLGAVREHDFIKGDEDDIDLCLLEGDYWKVRELLEKNNYDIKNIWRREIAIDFIDTKIDMFFCRYDDNYVYIPTYRKNIISHKWDIERRYKYRYNIIFPLKQIMFLGQLFNIPHDYNRKLSIHYGNWKVPDRKFRSAEERDKTSAYDEHYREVAINIPLKIVNKRMIDSIKNTYPENLYRINVMEELTNIEEPTIYQYPYTPFILYVTKPVIFDKKINLSLMIDALITEKNIISVSGNINKPIKYTDKWNYMVAPKGRQKFKYYYGAKVPNDGFYMVKTYEDEGEQLFANIPYLVIKEI